MPSTFTSRLTLEKPDGGDTQDISKINANLDKLDLYNGLHQCTSGTRPASPWRGLLAEETDTGKIIRWNGSAWVTLYYDSGWLTPTLASSWDNNNTLAYRIITDKVVLRGAIRHDSGSQTGPSINTAVATLPTGARPATTQRLGAIKWVSGAGNNEWLQNDAVITVNTNGNIDAHHPLATAYTGIICDGLWFPLG